MAWRTIVISKPARLRVENDQLAIVQEETVCLPLEDIAVLVLESPEIVLTAALLSRLAKHEVILLACDERHLPALAGIPFAGHSRLARVQRSQIESSLPFQKRCWQAVVKQKIQNQAACLRLLGRDGAQTLEDMAGLVASGDSQNLESVAAREYFRYLFGEGFVRRNEDWENHALDYGYAVLRAAVARALAVHGFLVALGIHHHSELNQFNLADDFLEPLRPLVDLCVSTMAPNESLTKSDRETLAALLHVDILVEEKRQQVLQAVDIVAGSFLAACRDKDPRLLKLPALLPLQMHAYE